MALEPVTIDDAFEQGLRHHRAGRLGEAEALYRRVLAAQPRHADALHFLGLIADQAGRPEAALDLIRQAIAINPRTASYHCNEGLILTRLGRFESAVLACRRALDLNASSIEACQTLAAALQQAGRRDEATAAYQRLIALKPDHWPAMNVLGNLLANAGRLEEAMTTYRRLIELRPDHAPARSNLAAALAENGSPDEASANARRALELRPDYPEALINLGNALAAKGQTEEAIECYRRAIELLPGLPDAHYNLGNALRDIRDLDGAIASYRKALLLRPEYPQAHANLAGVLRETGRVDEAIAQCRQALAIVPTPTVAASLIYTLYFDPGADAAAIRDAQEQWSDAFARPLMANIRPHPNDRSPERRLRVGYVSPDFRDHVIGRNVLPLLREHGHGEFEIFCYSGVRSLDEMTEEFRRRADQWRDISRIGDERLVDLVRSDRIDILVDLTLHLSGSRLLAFAAKPAPVQVTFAGYPAATGLATMDWRLSDPHLDPSEAGDGDYVEKTFRLPHTFWCYEPDGNAPEVGPPPALAAGHVTFGCLNNFAKVNPAVIRLWSRVLASVPGSRLLLLCPQGEHRASLVVAFQDQGVEAERMELVEPGPRPQYLGHYQRIDIGLDTFPYNGHTTSLDAFWMGVPVVTLVGVAPVGRAGWSQLSNLGLRELAADTQDQYVALAAALATDLPRLAQLRSTLRQRMLSSPLTDARQFARGIEAAFRDMWRVWCRAAPV